MPDYRDSSSKTWLVFLTLILSGNLREANDKIDLLMLCVFGIMQGVVVGITIANI